MSAIDLALANLVSPVVLFFVLGLAAALARSDMSIPEAAAKTLALYLMMSIGFKGGVEVSKNGVSAALGWTMAAGVLLSALTPVAGYAALRIVTRLPVADAAALAAHYGSISIVTFVAGTQMVQAAGLAYEGWMIAVAAAMETPAIVAALLLARRGGAEGGGEPVGALLREIGLNASVVMLVGAFAIGAVTGEAGLKPIASFLVEPFRGVLCLFLLDMGLVAGRGLRQSRAELTPALIGFGVAMPLVSALVAALITLPLPLSAGGAALFITLAASASYIAVPAAMRLALPEARPSIYLTMSLGVTFPFNLVLGLPIYLALALKLTAAGP